METRAPDVAVTHTSASVGNLPTKPSQTSRFPNRFHIVQIAFSFYMIAFANLFGGSVSSPCQALWELYTVRNVSVVIWIDSAPYAFTKSPPSKRMDVSGLVLKRKTEEREFDHILINS